VTIDATGLAQGAVSTFFVRRMYHHTQQPLPWRHWLKWLAVVDLKRQLILAQSARQAPWNDCAHLPELVSQAHALTPVGCVLADAEFDSERNHTFDRQQLHALSVIPAKRGKKTWRIHGVRAEMRNHFPRQKYCRRRPDRNCLLGRRARHHHPCHKQTPTTSPKHCGDLDPVSLLGGNRENVSE
jgi:hypothetical protein